jgi:phosphoribosylanthranilate isomerase
VVKVKICGFTNPEDVKVACELGVDMVGAILVPKSSRFVTARQAKQILNAVSEGIAKVAVIMPKDFGEVEKMARELKPDYLQIHLTFPAGKLLKLKERLDVGLIIVTPIPREIENRKKIIDQSIEAAEVADYVLLDTKGPSGGGTGLTHDWSLSGEIRVAVKKPIFLAGGLNASNVGPAIKIVRPYGVDVATGVESSPGKKDARLMREFIGAVREA